MEEGKERGADVCKNILRMNSEMSLMIKGEVSSYSGGVSWGMKGRREMYYLQLYFVLCQT